MYTKGAQKRGGRGPASFDRAGFGTVLTVVLAILFCLAAAGVGHGLFSSFVSEQTHRYSMGDLALELAANAITSGHFLLGQSVNRPDGALGLYGRFRAELADFEFELPQRELPCMEEELLQNKNFALIDEMVKGEVLFQQANSAVHPTEHSRFGTIRLSAAVTYKPTGVVRRLSKTYDFRLSLTSAPRPFDQTTVFIHDPTPLINSYAFNGDANQYIVNANKRLSQLKQATNDFIRHYNNAISDASGKKGADGAIAVLRQCIAMCQQVLKNYPPDVKIETNSPCDTDGKENTLHLFPPQGTFAIWTKSNEVILDDLNLADKVRQRNALLAPLDPKKVNELHKQISNFLNGKPRNLGPLIGMQRKWCDAALEAAKLWYALLIEDYKGFQDRVQEMGADDYVTLEKHMASMESPDDWVVQASSVLVEGDPFKLNDERKIDKKLVDLLEREKSFSGVLYVKNTTEPLTISRVFSGRLVLVVEGDLTIEKAILGDKREDMLTIICFGRLSVDGPTEASLVANYTFTTDESAPIRGNLYVRELSFDGLPLKKVMASTITYDERLQCGPLEVDETKGSVFGNYQHFALGPNTVFAAVGRK